MTRATRRGSPASAWKQAWSGRLVQNAAALILSGGGTALLGLAFWSVAAHEASAATVGRCAAELAAMVLLSSLAQLSFGSVFERYIPVAGDRTKTFVAKAYVMCVVAALVISIAYLLLGFAHHFLPKGLGWQALFVAAVILWTIFNLQDSALIGLRATRWVPLENIVYALLKLALIPIFLVVTSNQGLLLAWIAPVVLVIGVVTWFLFGRLIPRHQRLSTSSEGLPSTKELLFLSGAQYGTLLISVITFSLSTLIVLERLGPIKNAHYYLPSQITSGVALFIWSVVRSFLVEASAERDQLHRHARTTLRALLLVVVPAVFLGIVLAPQLLSIFGPQYAQDGSTLLRLLLLSLPCTAITAFYSSFAWLDRKVWWMTVRELVSTIVYFVVLLALISREGILALGIASLATSAIQAILFLPILIRRYRATYDSVVG